MRALLVLAMAAGLVGCGKEAAAPGKSEPPPAKAGEKALTANQVELRDRLVHFLAAVNRSEAINDQIVFWMENGYSDHHDKLRGEMDQLRQFRKEEDRALDDRWGVDRPSLKRLDPKKLDQHNEMVRDTRRIVKAKLEKARQQVTNDKQAARQWIEKTHAAIMAEVGELEKPYLADAGRPR